MDDLTSNEPVYLLKDRPLPQPDPNVPTGAINLLTHHGLKSAYHKYCQKRVKETLSHYLPDLSGVVNMPVESSDGLRALIEGPPPVQKCIEPLNATQMDSFRLQNVTPNTRLPDKVTEELLTTARKKNKKKKDKDRDRSRKIEKKSDKDRKEKRKKKKQEKEKADIRS